MSKQRPTRDYPGHPQSLLAVKRLLASLIRKVRPAT